MTALYAQGKYYVCKALAYPEIGVNEKMDTAVKEIVEKVTEYYNKNFSTHIITQKFREKLSLNGK